MLTDGCKPEGGNVLGDVGMQDCGRVKTQSDPAA